MGDIDKWIEIAKECKYLPENDLKVYCIIGLVVPLSDLSENLKYVERNALKVCQINVGGVTICFLFVLFSKVLSFDKS